jgi:hypothetical protein
MSGHRQIGADLHPAGAIVLCIEPARSRRSHHAGSPDDGIGIESPVLKFDAMRIAGARRSNRYVPSTSFTATRSKQATVARAHHHDDYASR